MNNPKRKLATVALVALTSFAAVQTVVAQGLGIDLISLAQQKAAALAGLSTSNVSSELEQAKQETLTDTMNYVDQYISDIQQSLEQYANQETEAAKQQVRDKGEEVKDTLEASKQGIIDNEKNNIKIKVKEELDKKLSEIDNELSIKIKDKFTN